jgi:hypothetical protein
MNNDDDHTLETYKLAQRARRLSKSRVHSAGTSQTPTKSPKVRRRVSDTSHHYGYGLNGGGSRLGRRRHDSEDIKEWAEREQEQEHEPEPSSPEEGAGNFHKSLQIDMKGLVGDAVGNVSSSCWSGATGAEYQHGGIDEYQSVQQGYCACCVCFSCYSFFCFVLL